MNKYDSLLLDDVKWTLSPVFDEMLYSKSPHSYSFKVLPKKNNFIFNDAYVIFKDSSGSKKSFILHDDKFKINGYIRVLDFSSSATEPKAIERYNKLFSRYVDCWYISKINYLKEKDLFDNWLLETKLQGAFNEDI